MSRRRGVDPLTSLSEAELDALEARTAADASTTDAEAPSLLRLDADRHRTPRRAGTPCRAAPPGASEPARPRARQAEELRADALAELVNADAAVASCDWAAVAASMDRLAGTLELLEKVRAEPGPEFKAAFAGVVSRAAAAASKGRGPA